ncbi:MAG: TRAM domain-containing protein [Ardenticatenales bacterium]|nr:TRAM domain-containing protein [Ardenticatenales bacterium]
MIGLLLSALLTPALARLPAPFNRFLPFGSALVLGYLGASIVGRNPNAYLSVLSRILSGKGLEDQSGRYILLDTSVIIDGRIADVAETGFIDKTLLVPRFILAELQQIADSSDGLRRNRGRRGLEILNRLQNSKAVQVEITDKDAPGTHEVDRKLVRLAQDLNCPVMTNDYNLNRVAAIESVRALNLNELSNAVKTILLPGEQMDIRIIQEGKEFGQGVGYLEDGTMVVVEGGRDHVDEMLDVTVTRVLQTVAGRMIFAQAAGAANALPSQRTTP